MQAIEAVGRVKHHLIQRLPKRVFQEVRRAVKEEEASAFANLSQQERHVLLLVSEGKQIVKLQRHYSWAKAQ